VKAYYELFRELVAGRTGGGAMTGERRDRKRLRRRRDDQVAIEFRVAVDALEDLDAIEERERRQQCS
jgi:hypothetical protein